MSFRVPSPTSVPMRLPWRRGAACVALTALCGCAPAARPTSRVVDVQPRVQIVGGLELAARSSGRIFVDEILAHAPSASVIVGDDATRADELVDARTPLLFGYDVDAGDGSALGGARRWDLPVDGAVLDVSFDRLRGADDVLASVPSAAMFAPLAGHTLVVTGRIALPTERTASGFADVDPDGSPAIPDPERGDVDPDGAPADGTGDASDVDPDGSPADVDPDGSPADVDPDGSPADVDPDGAPADGTSTGTLAARTGATQEVPFQLVVDDAFITTLALDAGAIADVDDGEVLPLDLRVSMSTLFNDERIAQLEALADAARATSMPVHVAVSEAESSAAIHVGIAPGMRAPSTAKVRQTSSRIHVSGDLRR